MFDCLKLRNIAIFAGGVLFGTAGVKVLASKDAKKVYVNCLAAGLRAKDTVMTTATTIQENADDILAEAKEINRKREEDEEAVITEEEAPAEADAKKIGRDSSRRWRKPKSPQAAAVPCSVPENCKTRR